MTQPLPETESESARYLRHQDQLRDASQVPSVDALCGLIRVSALYARRYGYDRKLQELLDRAVTMAREIGR